MLSTIRTENLFLAIQFIKGIRPEHDALGVFTVAQTQQVPDFMCPLF